jgi:cell division protein FtsX
MARIDIPFAADDAHRILPLITMCLVAFMTLLLCLAVSLFSGVGEQAGRVSGSVQIEVPLEVAERALPKLTDALNANPNVVSVQVLDHATMHGLLKPWLGEAVSLEALELPILMDVVLRDADMDMRILQTELRRVAPSITIQSRSMWMAHVTRASAVLQWILVAVSLMLITCIGALVMLVSRTSLKLHFQTISLLHMFGATDRYITQQFQRYHARFAARYALFGAAIGGLVYALIGLVLQASDSPLLPRVSLDAQHLLLLALLPAITAFVARLAARNTVQHMLQHMH